MSGLRVVPVRRNGRQWWYVTRPDGRQLAWYDRESGRVSVLDRVEREAVLEALEPFLSGSVTVGPPPVPSRAEIARMALHPDDDLAPNRPGETLLAELEHRPGPLSGHLSRLRPDPRRAELAAEQEVGAALDLLEAGGWRTLHSFSLPGGDRVRHLIVGPGGVLVLQPLRAHRQRVRISGTAVRLGRRAPQPLLRPLRSSADRAAYVLDVEVRPALVLLGPAEVHRTESARDVRVLRDAGITALGYEGGVLKPADVDAVFALARDRSTWLRA
ncbi:NERD domain-containing protein [Streptomyces sp. NA04227]|uniref:nuclease-related domain-containing protein n=1 Tax=Streptomyces sp. NA04227 TaxID=2742136 RepID=UPI001590FBDA|nr:nuclease-related domain-containing protein [Streptomyces sp. NA04227]QKW09096.1 NERD domain-containing protein [Streptomyces sp. NA04227]